MGSDPFIPMQIPHPQAGENPMHLSLLLEGKLLTFSVCGHAGTSRFSIVTPGEFGDVKSYEVPDHVIDGFCRATGFECPECFFARIAPFVIPCVICRRPILPGEQIVFWPVAPISEFASYQGHAIGCMLMGCATGYGESAGVWTSKGAMKGDSFLFVS